MNLCFVEMVKIEPCRCTRLLFVNIFRGILRTDLSGYCGRMLNSICDCLVLANMREGLILVNVRECFALPYVENVWYPQ